MLKKDRARLTGEIHRYRGPAFSRRPSRHGSPAGPIAQFMSICVPLDFLPLLLASYKPLRTLSGPNTMSRCTEFLGFIGDGVVASVTDRFAPEIQVGGTDWDSSDRSRAARSSHRVVMVRGRLALPQSAEPQFRFDSGKHCTLNCRRSVAGGRVHVHDGWRSAVERGIRQTATNVHCWFCPLFKSY